MRDGYDVTRCRSGGRTSRGHSLISFLPSTYEYGGTAVGGNTHNLTAIPPNVGPSAE